MRLDADQMLAVLNALPDPVFLLTESGLYAGLFGHADPNYYHDGHDLLGSSVPEVVSSEAAEWIMQNIHKALEQDGLIKVEYQLSADQVAGLEDTVGPDGMIWFEGHVQPFPHRVNGERAVVWIARNITRRKLLEEELLQASQTDPLTQTANRRHLMEVLEEHFEEFRRYRHPMAMIMFDLDHFKQLNDRHGHLTGDAVLRSLCKACKSLLRANDLLARFGGEEFVIVLPNTTAAQAASTAERMRTHLSEAVARELGDELAVTVSLGVSELLHSDSNYEQVMHRGDQALYRAKRAGRNRVVVYDA